MKTNLKIILLVICLFAFTKSSFSQANKNASVTGIADSANQKKQAENILRTANDLKSGNWQDVLSSFLQLSVSDLTGTNKSLNFKSTLFALKAKADTTLWVDKKYVSEKFARNFQFDFSLKLDSSYRFNGFQGGFTWAIINKRDSSVFSLVNSLADSLYLVSANYLQLAFISFQQSITDPITGQIKADKLQLFKDIKQKFEDAYSKAISVSSKLFPPEFQIFLAPYVKKGYDDNVKRADSMLNIELDKLRTKPLLTLSVNSTFKNDQQAFNNGDAQFVYLQGIKTKKSITELDIRLSGNIRDTVIVSKERRADAQLSAGINFSLFQGNSQKSFFEFKPYLEYKSVLTRLIGSEKKNLFSANADLRLRLTDNLWLPFTIKYDFNKKNFLGFLNIAFNFNAFKNKS